MNRRAVDVAVVAAVGAASCLAAVGAGPGLATGGSPVAPAGQRVAPSAVGATAMTVTLSLSATQASVGEPLAVTVQIQPGGRRQVLIQARSSTQPWQTEATLRTDAAGNGRTTWLPLTGDDYVVRAVAPATGSRAAGVSAAQLVPAKYGNTVPVDRLDPLVPGALTVGRRAVGTEQLGEFRVSVRKAGDRGPLVRVTDGAGRVAWASDPGRAFVAASRNRVQWIWRSTAGAFWPQVQRTTRLTRQTVNRVRSTGNGLEITGTLRGSGDRAPYTLTLRQVRRSAVVNAVRLDVRVAKARSGVVPNSVQLTSGRARRAAVHGLGEQFRPFDLSGQVVPILVQEQGVTRGEEPAARIVDFATWGAGNLNTTYAPWPTYVTAQNRSFELVDDLASGAFGIADMSRRTQVSVESFRSRMRAHVMARSTPKSLMAARAAGDTRPNLAGWIQRGAVLGIQGGTDKVRRVVADMRQAGARISGVWLQDWVGKRVTGFGEQLWWTWQLNRARYPGWDRMVRDFAGQGIRVMTYVNPFVIDADSVDGQRIKNYYRIGERNGFLVKNRLGRTYVVQTIGFPTAMVDLTNPKARDWFARIIARNVLGAGASGFMADFGEYLPFDAVLHTGTGMTQHNRYPRLWAQTVRQGCRRGGVPDCVAFFRAGYLGTSKDAPLMWAGDQMVNYAAEDGMISAVKGMLAGGVSGAPLWHSDIGGYTSVNTGVVNFLRSPELNARWAQMQAFGPVMRTHETNRPRLNQQVYDTPATRAQFARASRIYAALRDYRADVVREAVRRGIPAMRHPWLVFPGSRVARQDVQFFLGDHLFVAPVYAEGARSVAVTFPPGRWRHLFTGAVFRGDRVTDVAAPLGTPAAFVRVGDPVGDRIVRAVRAAGLAQR